MPKHMVEWVLNKKAYKNPELIQTLSKMRFPLLAKYGHFY